MGGGDSRSDSSDCDEFVCQMLCRPYAFDKSKQAGSSELLSDPDATIYSDREFFLSFTLVSYWKLKGYYFERLDLWESFEL